MTFLFEDEIERFPKPLLAQVNAIREGRLWVSCMATIWSAKCDVPQEGSLTGFEEGQSVFVLGRQGNTLLISETL